MEEQNRASELPGSNQARRIRMGLNGILRLVTVVTLVAVVWLFGDMNQAFAAEDVEGKVGTEYGIVCEDGSCRVEFGDLVEVEQGAKSAAFWLEVAENNLHFLPEGTGVEFSDELTIHAPQGVFELVDSELLLRMDEQGEFESLQGRALLDTSPWSMQEDGTLAQPNGFSLGYMVGDKLPQVDVEIQPERRYLLFQVVTDLRAIRQNVLGHELRESTLEIPSGQQATLLIDPAGPWLYVNGNTRLHSNGVIGILDAVNNPDQALLDWDTIPVPSTLGIQISGMVTPDLEDAYLRLYGGYEVHIGQVGRWLNLEDSVLMTQGTLALDRAGIMVDGEAQASILPKYLLDSDIQLAVFVPFDDTFGDMYVHLYTDADLPLAGVHMDRAAELEFDGQSEFWASRWSDVGTTMDGVLDGSQRAVQRAQDTLEWTGSELGKRTVGLASSGLILIGK